MNTIRTTTQIVAVLAVLALGIQAAAQESEALPSRLADVEQAVDLIRKRYVYDSGLDWTRLRKKYLLEAASLGSNFKRFELLERLVEELHDHHAHLNQNSTSSYRLVPSGLHVWASYQHTNYIVDEVRAGSAAERSGLRGGDIILELDEIPVAKAVRKRLKPFQIQDTDEARSWAVRTLLAGKHEQKKIRIGIERDGKSVNVDFALGSANSGERPTLETTDLDNGICHVRINNSLGDQELVRKFDEVADRLGEGNRLILDLRNTPGGGNTMVARGVMGRLLHKELAYQRHEFLESPLQIPRVWVEYALPRGQKQFTGPVVVLVGRWTGSMGEGIAIGLDNRPSTTIVRNRMAGLKGATQKFSAGHSSTGIFLPVEKLFHIDGVPREDFEPSVFVNPKTTPKGSKFGNQVLHAAVDLLSTRN